jgi:hypothetical protein
MLWFSDGQEILKAFSIKTNISYSFKEPYIGHYPEPVKASPHCHIIFLEDPF